MPTRHPLSADAERRAPARAHRRLRPRRVAGRRRSDRRRVHLRRRGARVARGAGADPASTTRPRSSPGGAGNAANNVAALGGARAAGRRSPAATKPGAGCSTRCTRASTPAHGASARREYRTPIKTRILAGGMHSAKQQVVRIDREHRLAARRRRSATAFEREGSGRHCAGAMPCSCRTTAPASSRRRSSTRLRPRRRRAAAAAAASGPAWIRATPAGLPRADRVHAERVGGRAGLGVAHRRRARALERAGRDDAAAHGDAGGAHHPRQPRHGALRAAQPTGAHSRSSAPTRSPTSRARATR